VNCLIAAKMLLPFELAEVWMISDTTNAHALQLDIAVWRLLQ
jgi:hypothetical protein